MNENVRIELSSCALTGPDAPKIASAAIERANQYGFTLGVQIHNTAEKELLDKIRTFDLPLSFHAPVLTDYVANFAAKDSTLAFEMLDQTATLMRKCNVDKAVFHGFFMTDNPIPAFGRGKTYEECARAVWRPELVYENSCVCKDFSCTPEFSERLGRLKQNLRNLKTRYDGLEFMIENDCPLYVSGMMFPETFQDLEFPVCLDIGHLWASSFVFQRDFIDSVRIIAETSYVKMAHLHTSPFTSAVPKEKWTDGHKNFSSPTQMNVAEVIRILKQNNVKHFIFEFNEFSTKDIDIFAKMWDGK
ncbi:MAG: hypothetical protein A2020_11205 [Lentisphaerae bacterium GWF2_45_14]|nr:MAG: hypothetical protein A2020_11205 [Lentisphaerae bacterium GWF2_45_14]